MELGLVRVVRAGGAMAHFPTEEALDGAAIDGFFVEGKRVHIRAFENPAAGSAGESWTILLPWRLKTYHFWAILGSFAALTVSLARLGNSFVLAVLNFSRTWSTGSTGPATILALVAFAAAVLIRARGFSFPSWENDTSSYFKSVFHVVDGGLPLATPDRPFGYPLGDALEAAKTSGFGSYTSLGYDADSLYFFALPDAPRFAALPVEQRASLCQSLFAGGLWHHPELYLRKVVLEMGFFFKNTYAKPNIHLPHVEVQLARSEMAVAAGEMPPRFAAGYAPLIATARRELARPWPSDGRLTLSTREILIYDAVRATFTWCVLFPILVCALCIGVPRVRAVVDWRRFAPALAIATWSFGSAFLSALSTAATQGLDIQRYIQLSIPLTMLSHVLFPVLGGALLLAFWRAFCGAPQPTNAAAMPAPRALDL